MLSTYDASISMPRGGGFGFAASDLAESPLSARRGVGGADPAVLGDIASIDAFLSDCTQFARAMRAYGLEDMTFAKGLVRRVLESDPEDPKSLANTLGNGRYRKLVTDVHGRMRAARGDAEAAAASAAAPLAGLAGTAMATAQIVPLQPAASRPALAASLPAASPAGTVSVTVPAAAPPVSAGPSPSPPAAPISATPARSGLVDSGQPSRAVMLGGTIPIMLPVPRNARPAAAAAASVRLAPPEATAQAVAAPTAADIAAAAIAAVSSAIAEGTPSSLRAALNRLGEPEIAAASIRPAERVTAAEPAAADAWAPRQMSDSIFALPVPDLAEPVPLRAPEPTRRGPETASAHGSLTIPERQALAVEAAVRYFRDRAASITSPYAILADPLLLLVVTAVLGPGGLGETRDIDDQAEAISARIRLRDFHEPGKLDKFLRRFATCYGQST